MATSARRWEPRHSLLAGVACALVVVSAFLVVAQGALGAATRPVHTALTLSLGTAGRAGGSAGVPASLVAPGDSIQRTLDLGFTTRPGPARVELKVSTPRSSLLDSSRARGLRLTIDACLAPWKRAGSPLRYTCKGPISTALARISVARVKTRGAVVLRGVHLGSVTHLRIRLTLPPSSTNAFQGKASAVRLGLRLVSPAP